MRWLELSQPGSPHRQQYEMIERWRRRYPSDGAVDLGQRLGSKLDDQFESAFFELYLFTLFRHAWPGIAIDVPPHEPGLSRPDFTLGSAGGDRVDLEAVVFKNVEEQSAFDRDGGRILREATPHVRLPGFAFIVESFERGRCEPGKRAVAAALTQAAQGLDHAALTEHGERGGASAVLYEFPRIVVEEVESGWRWLLTPIPLRTPQTEPDSVVCMQSGEGYRPVRAQRSRGAIRQKVKQHRERPSLLIVAICCNSCPGEPSDQDMVGALVGTEHGRVDWEAGELSHGHRHADGLWTSPHEDLSRPAAVISTSRCLPETVPHGHMTMWVNPHRKPCKLIETWPFRLVQWNGHGGEASVREGVPPIDVFKECSADEADQPR